MDTRIVGEGTDGRTNWQVNRQRDSKTDKQTERQIETDRQKDKQTDRKTYKIDIHRLNKQFQMKDVFLCKNRLLPKQRPLKRVSSPCRLMNTLDPENPIKRIHPTTKPFGAVSLF